MGVFGPWLLGKNEDDEEIDSGEESRSSLSQTSFLFEIHSNCPKSVLVLLGCMVCAPAIRSYNY